MPGVSVRPPPRGQDASRTQPLVLRRLTVTSKRFEGKTRLVGRWYGTAYNAEPIDPALLKAWSEPEAVPALRLPDPNPFIATDFDMLPPEAEEEAAAAAASAGRESEEEEAKGPKEEEGGSAEDTVPEGRRAPPRCILDTPAARLFYKRQSSDYEASPKAVFTMQLITPEAYHTPEHAVLTRLFSDLVEDALSELAYPAQVAALSYEVSGLLTGLKVSVAGYSHKLPLLFTEVVKKLAEGYTPDERFERIREIATRQHENALLEQPRDFASFTLGVASEASPPRRGAGTSGTSSPPSTVTPPPAPPRPAPAPPRPFRLAPPSTPRVAFPRPDPPHPAPPLSYAGRLMGRASSRLPPRPSRLPPRPSLTPGASPARRPLPAGATAGDVAAHGRRLLRSAFAEALAVRPESILIT
eukprot:tig00021070_g17910.t1